MKKGTGSPRRLTRRAKWLLSVMKAHGGPASGNHPAVRFDHLALTLPKGERLPPLRLSMDTLKSDLLEALQHCEPSFKRDYLVEQVFSKYLDEKVTPAETRRQNAIRKFRVTEEHNHRTNVRLYQQYSLMGVDFHDFVEEVRRIIRRVLGSVSEVDLSSASFTNGASVGVRRSSTASLRKLQGEQHLSASAVKWYLEAFSGTILGAGQNREGSTIHHGVSQDIILTEESVLFTVPKKTDIDRVACKEPAGNALLQRSVGEHIRNRLLKVGIDLRDQTRNQYYAYVGSLAGEYATIDLSSASDTMTTSLVAILLPGEWWCMLDDLRVHSTTIDGTVHHLNMFSSMGNGFTFELETLIFYALAKVTMKMLGIRGKCLAYGDDIIVPSAAYKPLLRNLRCFGFLPNAEKTHGEVRDHFRESCGKHYRDGLDISPFYIKGPVDNWPKLTNVLNHLLEWDGRGWGFFIEPSLADFWASYRVHIPSYLWGGVSIDDPSALVTGDNPRARLVPLSKRLHRNSMNRERFTEWLMRTRQGGDLRLATEIDPCEHNGRFRTAPLSSAWGTTSWKPLLIQGESS